MSNSSPKDDRKPLVRLTKKDFRIDWFSGSGAGGMNRNKVKNCCRIHHDPSGTMAIGQEHRDAPSNQKQAFKRLCDSPEFKKWLHLESLRAMGKEDTVEQAVDKQMKEAVVEVKDQDGKWVKE